MSFDFNHKYWISTRKEINQLLKKQNRLKKVEPVEDPLISFQIFSELYVLYTELVNKLSLIYLHTYQVQKRAVVRALVENAINQLMKLKAELKSLELNEYVYIDKALIARKLTPTDLLIWKSPQFLYRRPFDIQNIVVGNKLFMNDVEKAESEAADFEKIRNAVKIIQAHERARRARVYKSSILYDKKKFLKLKQRNKINYRFMFKPDQAMSIPIKRTVFNVEFLKDDPACDDIRYRDEMLDDNINEEARAEINRIRNEAALKIQAFWRGYKARKIVKMRRNLKYQIYGMKKTRRILRPNEYANSVLEMYKSEMLKKKLDDEFIQLITDERTRLLQERTPWMMEDISDHIRGWFSEFYEKTGDFHPYPDPIKTGTILVVIDETMTPIEFQETLNKKPMSKEEKKKLAEKKKAEKQKKKDKWKKQKLKEAKRRKKMRDAGVIDIGYEISSSTPIANIENVMKDFAIDWRYIDEYLNKNHDPIKDWVTEDELSKIHQELRGLVDEYMRIEYELLKKALAKDKKEKYKPSKVKKAKQKKPKKKKIPKDMTADRSLESLYNELKDAGIIEEFPQRDFDEFISDFNFVADDTRDEDHLTTIDPSKGDIKMVVQECMMGLGEFDIPKPKSLLLIGPLNSGKKLLCNTITAELNAVFMNLSPEKVIQFQDDMKYFLHVVMKVAKAFQPTVLFVDEAHRLFWKKIPPDQKEINPRLLAPFLKKKILKLISKKDKILLLGTSNIPWSAKGKFKKSFEKVLLIPKCDYGTSFLLWLELMTENASDNLEDYTYSALAKVLQAYNSGDIYNNVENTLNIRRRMRLKSEPLDPNEFLEYFLTNHDPPMFPPDDKLMQKFNKWFGKSNKFSKMKRKFLAAKEAKKKKK